MTDEQNKEYVNEQEIAAEQTDDDKQEGIVTEHEKRPIPWGDIVFFVVSFFVLFFLFKIFPPYRVDGESMNQTLKDKAFGFGVIAFTPDYGDIVVLHGDNGKTNDDDYIKRIVGKPGDILEITDGVIVRNGEKIDEPYAYYDPEYMGAKGETQIYVLEEDEYLVMGDNRYHSYDGRWFGPISRSEMKCKMLFFLWGKKR